MTINLSDPYIAKDIAHRLLSLKFRLDLMLGKASPSDSPGVIDRAGELADALAGNQGRVIGEKVAQGILENLIDLYQQTEPYCNFWTSRLGLALAWWTGAPLSDSRMVAQQVFDCSRQYVHKLFGPGELDHKRLAAEIQRRNPNPIAMPKEATSND